MSKYFGNCKQVTFEVEGQQRSKLRVGLYRDHLQEMLALCNEKGWINLDISKRKEPGQFGDTHSIKHDSWKPNTEQARENIQSSSPQVQHQNLGQPNANAGSITMDNFDDDIPF